MQKIINLLSIFAFVVLSNSCASSYVKINPEAINYVSKNTDGGVTLEYKYDLLSKKYKKKESSKNLKMVAIKITNNSNNDLVFGQDIKLVYENNNNLNLMDNDLLFSQIKQTPAKSLLFLLLSVVNLTITRSGTYGAETDVYRVGLILGPSLAFGNMIAASNANKALKNELAQYSLLGKVIKKGESMYGLISINATNFEALKIKSNFKD